MSRLGLEQVPAVAGWFTLEGPRLVGQRCGSCRTVVFPPRAPACPNPGCDGTGLEPAALSPTGRLWSWATNHYPPPEPYVAPDPFVPYTVAAVELDAERLVVLGQLAEGTDAAALQVGQPMQLALRSLFTDADAAEQVVWAWEPA